MNTNTTPLITEIGVIIISVAIVAGAIVLLILGKTDYAQTAGLIGTALALWGAYGLYKAPNPAQMSTLKVLQDQASTLQEAASTHDAQIQSQQQQIGSVQELALQAANTAASVASQVQSVQVQSAAPALQFVQPMPQPVPQYYIPDRHFGDSMPLDAIQTQRIATVP